MIDPAGLARSNLSYRRPEPYDQLTTSDDDQAAHVARVVAELGVTVFSVLDRADRVTQHRTTRLRSLGGRSLIDFADHSDASSLERSVRLLIP